MDQIDSVVKKSLESLEKELRGEAWTGRRERKVISLFCFGHLLRHCRPDSIFADPTQIAIEVAVPQISGQRALTGKEGGKAQVCKDIVIWRTARATCWDENGKATICPLAVVEWKHNTGTISSYDLSWLCEFSARVPDFVGYAVTTNRPAKNFALSCTRVAGGQLTDQWLHLQ